MALFGRTPGDGRRPGPRPFSGAAEPRSSPSHQPIIGRRNTVAPFSAVPESLTSPQEPRDAITRDEHATSDAGVPESPAIPVAPQMDGDAPSSALNVEDLRLEPMESLLAEAPVYEPPHEEPATGTPPFEEFRGEPEAAPSIESATDQMPSWYESEVLPAAESSDREEVNGPEVLEEPSVEGQWTEPEPLERMPDEWWAEPARVEPEADHDVWVEPAAESEGVGEAWEESGAELETVEDATDWSLNGAGTPEIEIVATGDEPHLADHSAGTDLVPPETEQVLDALGAVADMVRSREIVVSAGAGSSLESILASILASLLSRPS